MVRVEGDQKKKKGKELKARGWIVNAMKAKEPTMEQRKGRKRGRARICPAEAGAWLDR